MTEQQKQMVHTALPLSMEEIKSFYTNKKNIHHIVDYDNSSLTGKGLLFYTSNLELNASFIFKDTTVEQKYDLIFDYMTIPNVCNIDTLNLTVADILLKAKNVDVPDLLINPILSETEITKFIELNHDLVMKWVLFVDSLLVFSMYVIHMGNNKEFDTSKYENINEPNYIGNNVVNLFNIPAFFELFFLALPSSLTFFNYQFTEYCFSGKNLFYYFTKQENWLLATVMGSLFHLTHINDT